MNHDSCESDTELTNGENKIKTKKKKLKDDTEQPIYPCEECTQCFITAHDLKVRMYQNLLYRNNLLNLLVTSFYIALLYPLIKDQPTTARLPLLIY